MPYLSAFFAVALAIFALRPLAKRAGLVDIPGGRREHLEQVPLVGGLAIAIGLATALAIRGSLAPASPALLASSLLVLAGGAIDDGVELSARAKLLIQIIGASVLAEFGSTLLFHVGALFSPTMQTLGVMLVVPFTILGVVGVMNAINMIDGADGLAGGITLGALGWFGGAAWLAGMHGHVLLIALFACAVAAYLCFNAGGPLARKYKVFLGDAGSMFAGLWLAWIAIELAMAPAAALKPVTAVWILAVPICDSVSLMLRRLVRGRSPFSADREHLHHLLQGAGLSRAGAVACMVLINAVFGAIALLAERYGVPEYVMFYAAMAIFAAYSAFCLQHFAHDHRRTLKQGR